jgi:CubicO group peptidase (beta-lactamase class C family)
MKNTGIHDPTTILEHEAQGYQFEGGQFKKSLNWDMSRAGAAGALYSTVGDLYRWNEALFSGKVLNETSLKAAFTPVIVEGDDVTKPKASGYGYGWTIQQIRGLQEIAHGGGLHGFVSYLLRLPKENFTVSVLVNTRRRSPGLIPPVWRVRWPNCTGGRSSLLRTPKIDTGFRPKRSRPLWPLRLRGGHPQRDEGGDKYSPS